MRQDLQNINTAKLAVVVADILIGLFLSKCHGCSASGGTPTLGGWDGLREMDSVEASHVKPFLLLSQVT